MVRWLSTLLLSTPALQPLLAADDAVMRQLLPALLVPLLDVLQPLGCALIVYLCFSLPLESLHGLVAGQAAVLTCSSQAIACMVAAVAAW